MQPLNSVRAEVDIEKILLTEKGIT